MAIQDTNTAGADSFWLNLTAESIYTSSDKREKSVKDLNSLILWTFGLFAAGTGGFLSIFGGIKDFDQYALISFAIAFFFLCLAYFCSNRALYPVAKTLHPADVASIKTAFTETTKKQIQRFQWASGFAAFGFFCLASGIFFQFWSLSKPKTQTPATVLSFNTKVEKRGDSTFIPVTIMERSKQSVDLSFIDNSSLDSSLNNKKILFNRVFLTDTTGRLYYSYHVQNDSIKTIIVKATFRHKATTDSLEEKSTLIKVILKK